MKFTSAIAAIAAAVSLAAAGTAHAAFTMILANGASTTTVTDNGAGDTDAVLGVINFTGVVGTFPFTITAGTSNSPGTAIDGGILQISSIAVRNTAAGQQTLTITLEDNGFTQPNVPSTLASSITGTLLRGAAGVDGISFQSFVDPSNTLGGTAISTTLQTTIASGVVTGVAAPDQQKFPVAISGPYAMTNVTTIKLSAGAQANISGTSVVFAGGGATTPEPMTASILGIASIGLLARRRRSA